MHQTLTKLTRIIGQSRTAISFINQMRQKIKTLMGNPATTPGGNVLNFSASLRLDIRRMYNILAGKFNMPELRFLSVKVFRKTLLWALSVLDRYRTFLYCVGLILFVFAVIWWSIDPSIGIREPLSVLVGALFEFVYFVPRISELPLSKEPQSHRIFGTARMVGYQREHDWMEHSTTDLLIVGQPGSGKTFLLQHLAEKRDGKFAFGNDRTKLRSAIKLYKPEIVFVDDAHFNRDTLDILLQIRKLQGQTFRVVASCWPCERHEINTLLQLPDSQILSLQPLSRDEIVEVVEEAGLTGSRELVREIVDQAQGRPGLAVTLSSLCLRGGVRDVVTGDALYENIKNNFVAVIGQEAEVVLATFALGGDHGVPVSVVAGQLGKREWEIQEQTKKMAFGGVLSEVGREILAVTPKALRFVLAREVYFTGATSLSVGDILTAIPNKTDFIITVIGAKNRGGKVADHYLIGLLEEYGDAEALEAYAWLGPDQARWVLRTYPDSIQAIAPATLEHAPDQAIPLLMTRAIGDTRETSGYPTHPLRILEDWVKRGDPQSDKAFVRRATLQRAVLHWVKTGDTHTAIRMVPTMLSPCFKDSGSDPGSGNKITLTFGYVSRNCIGQIQGLWPDIKRWLASITIPDWQPLFELIHHWTYVRPNISLPDETRAEMGRFVHTLLVDFNEVARGHSGVHRRVAELASRLQLSIESKVDPEFQALFPIEDFSDNRGERQQAQQAEAARLAVSWSNLDPESVVTKIVQFEVWALEAGSTYPRLTRFVCHNLAKTALDPKTWAGLLIRNGTAPDLIEPFLHKVVADRPEDWEELIDTCLSHQFYRPVTVLVLLPVESLPNSMERKLLTSLSGLENIVEHAAMRNELSILRVRQLLTHDDLQISGAVAIGLWLRRPETDIPSELREIWEAAIIRCSPPFENHWIKDILQSETDLAYRWVQKYLNDAPNPDQDILSHLISSFDQGRRAHLIDLLLEDGGYGEEVVNALVDKDIELYEQLLSRPIKRRYHLAPLEGVIDEKLIPLALSAMQYGYSADDIVEAIFGYSWSWNGNESDMWAQWLPQFELLRKHDSPVVRQIGETGDRIARKRIDQARARERREAVLGHGCS